MEKKTVNILGTEYGLTYDLDSKEADGEAKFFDKSIAIKPLDEMLADDSSAKEKQNRQKEVVRHELWHCLLYEGGMENYAYDENLINALAILSPKIFKVFQELDIL